MDESLINENDWRLIPINLNIKNPTNLRNALWDEGMNVGEWINSHITSPKFRISRETRADLIKVTVESIGFPNGARRDDIYLRVKEIGFFLCSQEDALQLRLQSPKVPKGESGYIGMEPIRNLNGQLLIFDMHTDGYVGGMGLQDGSPSRIHGPGIEWFFVKKYYR